jgi:ATP-dependent DNA helicase UvrD/PcrA
MPCVHAPLQPWVADLHIHSRYSRACSRDLELPNLVWWAQRKGITLLGTGDFTHPAGYDHLREQLVPAEPGLFRLHPDREAEVARRLPARLHAPVRFLLSVEIATIYKRDERTRKVHHLVYLPDLDAVARFNARLGRGGPGIEGLGGNLGSDGRPIVGLDSRDLLEVTLEASPYGFLVPAHIWTPWFSALGSKSGFDAIADCYADLAGHIHAVETGLSSDPAMNWRVSSLDGYQLVSNSDAHSPQALAREATQFTAALDFPSVKRAIETGDGLHGTIEFFPEEGKYHADGHRACGVCWEPERTRAAGGQCPECGKPLTVGVLHRVEELADRPAGYRPDDRPPATHLIQLHQILGELQGVGAKSKGVEGRIATLVAKLGSELDILLQVDLDEIARVGGAELGEAIGRLRAGQVHRRPGYDGEYGVIRLRDPAEASPGEGLFEMPVRSVAAGSAAVPGPRATSEPATSGKRASEMATGEMTTPGKTTRPATKTGRRRREARTPEPPLAAPPSPHQPWEPVLAGMEEVGTGLLDRLDALQRVAASAPGGALLVVAGPGTGKTRTLTHRIAYLCAELGVQPRECLAITFTRRAAEEMRTRLDALLGPAGQEVTVATFHALGLRILRENAAAVGLEEGFTVADAESASGDVTDDELRKRLREGNQVGLDELVPLSRELLRGDPELADRYHARWPWIFVDEYQDVDVTQYELLRALVPAGGNICAIGDPDQSIYSFRGADVGFFLRFAEDFPGAKVVRLARNYRSTAPIVAAAGQVIAAASLVRGRRLEPARLEPDAAVPAIHAAATPTAEAEWVARTIEELVGGTSHGSFDTGRIDSRGTVHEGLSFADMAVLYRTDAQAAAVVEALTRAGLPVQKRSHDRLCDRRAVAALARELQFAQPAERTGGQSEGNTGSVVERVRAAGRALAEGRPRLFEEDGSPSTVLPGAEVYAAVELLLPLASRCEDDLAEFLRALATGAEVDSLDPRAQAVTLLTLHAAKGLEWPVVFLIGCEDGLVPLRLPGRAPADEDVAEERRLFFVGVTRAQRRLYLSHCLRRTRHGAEQQPGRTPFLDPVDPGLLERMGDVEPARSTPRHRQLRLL